MQEFLNWLDQNQEYWAYGAHCCFEKSAWDEFVEETGYSGIFPAIVSRVLNRWWGYPCDGWDSSRQLADEIRSESQKYLES